MEDVISTDVDAGNANYPSVLSLFLLYLLSFSVCIVPVLGS